MMFLAHLANALLSLMFWMILGRMVLRLLTGGRENFFTGVFEKGTAPAFAAVRFLTGGRVGARAVPLLALLLVVAGRLMLLPLLS
ncbi:MAG: hypothetical protein ACRDVM_07630 [Acidimicrobiia bacterium]